MEDLLYCFTFNENKSENKLEISKSIFSIKDFDTLYEDVILTVQMIAPKYASKVMDMRIELDNFEFHKIYSLTDSLQLAVKNYISKMQRNIETVKKELKELQAKYNENQSIELRDEITALKSLSNHYKKFLNHATKGTYEFIDCSIEDTLEQELE